jgi:hypothetical protein
MVAILSNLNAMILNMGYPQIGLKDGLSLEGFKAESCCDQIKSSRMEDLLNL